MFRERCLMESLSGKFDIFLYITILRDFLCYNNTQNVIDSQWRYFDERKRILPSVQ